MAPTIRIKAIVISLELIAIGFSSRDVPRSQAGALNLFPLIDRSTDPFLKKGAVTLALLLPNCQRFLLIQYIQVFLLLVDCGKNPWPQELRHWLVS